MKTWQKVLVNVAYFVKDVSLAVLFYVLYVYGSQPLALAYAFFLLLMQSSDIYLEVKRNRHSMEERSWQERAFRRKTF